MPITAADFENASGLAPPERSTRFDAEHPALFDGLAPRYPTRLVQSCFLPMRDGVRLSTDFYIPLGARLPLPVVLVRTPYGKRGNPSALAAVFPEQGFVYALQDVRGRNESEGEFVACTAQDRDDGWDTIDWLARQPWCNGAIGTTGSSYVGETSAKAAATRHPAHRAAAVMFDGSYSGGESSNGAFLQGGITLMRMLFQWFRDYVPKVSYGPPAHVDREAWFSSPLADAYAMQPVRQPPVDLDAHLRTLPVFSLLDRSGASPSDFAEMMRRAADPADPYWQRQGFLDDSDGFDLPALYMTGHLERGGSAFDNFRIMQRNATGTGRRRQFLMLSPAPHSAYHLCDADTRVGERHLGDTRFGYYRMLVDWFGRWLRDDPVDVDCWPRVRYFVINRNAWREAAEWPPESSVVARLHLASGGRANSSAGDGVLRLDGPAQAEGHDAFVYDPDDPVPSEPQGASLDALGGGYAERSSIEARNDVLVYTSAPLAEPLEIGGPVRVELHVSSSASDTDFAAVLSEVGADGRSINVTHGMARARYRDGIRHPRLLTPGEVSRVTIDLWHAAIEIPAGHRLRLAVTSSHFPYYDRNLNTGGDNYADTAHAVATNRVHFGGPHDSALVLTVRPRDTTS